MITRDKVEILERLVGQLEGAYTEMSALAKKSPNDGVNVFTIGVVNSILTQCNELLSEGYRPMKEFDRFDKDVVPTNSDVTFVLSLYLQSIERYRSDNLRQEMGGEWHYDLPSGQKGILAAAPAKLKR